MPPLTAFWTSALGLLAPAEPLAPRPIAVAPSSVSATTAVASAPPARTGLRTRPRTGSRPIVVMSVPREDADQRNPRQVAIGVVRTQGPPNAAPIGRPLIDEVSPFCRAF